MKCRYAVTFEFLSEPPITERGISEAQNVRTVAARAIDETLLKNPNLKWNSISLLIEREG